MIIPVKVFDRLNKDVKSQDRLRRGTKESKFLLVPTHLYKTVSTYLEMQTNIMKNACTLCGQHGHQMSFLPSGTFKWG